MGIRIQSCLERIAQTRAGWCAKAQAAKGRKPKAVKTAKAGKGTKAAKGAKAKVAKARKPVAAKYRNAATGESWSGRGRAPKWLAAELAKGRKREEFAVG